jgi:hypothetical protein
MKKQIFIACFLAAIIVLVSFTTVVGTNEKGYYKIEEKEDNNKIYKNIYITNGNEFAQLVDDLQSLEKKYPDFSEAVERLLDNIVTTDKNGNIRINVVDADNDDLEVIVADLRVIIDELLLHFSDNHEVVSLCQEATYMLDAYVPILLCILILVVTRVIVAIYNVVYTLGFEILGIFLFVLILGLVDTYIVICSVATDISELISIKEVGESNRIAVYDSSTLFAVNGFDYDENNNYCSVGNVLCFKPFYEHPILTISKDPRMTAVDSNDYEVDVSLPCATDDINMVCSQLDYIVNSEFPNAASTRITFQYKFDFGGGKLIIKTVPSPFCSVKYQSNDQVTCKVKVDIEIIIDIDLNGDRDYDENEYIILSNTVEGSYNKPIQGFKLKFLQNIIDTFPFLSQLLPFLLKMFNL